LILDSQKSITSNIEGECGVEWLPPASKKIRTIDESVPMELGVDIVANVSSTQDDGQFTTMPNRGVNIASIIKNKSKDGIQNHARLPTYPTATGDGESKDHLPDLEARLVQIYIYNRTFLFFQSEYSYKYNYYVIDDY